MRHFALTYLLLTFLSVIGNSQICFTFSDDSNGGIDVCGSGSATVTQRAPGSGSIGVVDLGSPFSDESFREIDQNFTTTIDGQPWVFTPLTTTTFTDLNSTLVFNGVTLTNFFNGTGVQSGFGLARPSFAIIPDTDGITPINAAGCANFAIPISDLPGLRVPGGTTVIDLFGDGEILFKIITPLEPEIVPTLGQWGIISLAILLLIFGVQAVKQRALAIA